jgi:hypothetical protein
VSDPTVRRAVVQVERALVNTQAFNVFAAEIVVTAVAIGVYAQNWGWGLGSFAFLIVCLWQRPTQQLLAIVFSLAWAIGAYLAVHFMAPEQDIGAFVAAVVALMFAGAVHSCAFQWQRDFTN